MEEPTLPIIYQAVLADFDFRREDESIRSGSGRGETEAEALATAIGEAVERYCSMQPNPNAIIRAPATRVGGEAILPSECVLYSERQYSRTGFPYSRFDEQLEVGWALGRTLPKDEAVFVPAHFAFFHYLGEQPHEYFCPQTSNGFATGHDLDSAVLHGLCELIERDSFLNTWMNRLPVPQVDFSSLAGLPRDIQRHYERHGIRVCVFNITLDIPVYVMMGIALESSGRGPSAVVGLGCSLNPVIALRKALMEVCQVRPGVTIQYQREPPHGRLRSYVDVRTLHDHSAFFAMPERRPELSFLLDTPQVQRLEDLPNLSTGRARADLERCVDNLVSAGSRVAFVDITTPDIAELGIRVVSTFATGLQPMHFGYGEERLGGTRLYNIPRVLGYRTESATENDFNPCPHPLA